MGTLYIDRKGIDIKLDGNALAFYANGKKEGQVPINPLKRVVVVGNVTIEAHVINRLADEGITVVFLSGRRMRFHATLHGRVHNNGILRLKQYEKASAPENIASMKENGMNPNFPLEFSMEIVRRKTHAQLDFLKDAVLQRPDLRFPLTNAIRTLTGIADSLEVDSLKANSKCTSIDSIRGLEGSAAAAYFLAYTELFPESLNFNNRNRRPPLDPVNAMLSLCYTLLHYELVREIEVIGLDVTIGFYHQFEYGRESLACDLVELFRPDVDKFVWTIFRERNFTSRDFSYDNERGGCYLKKGGRQRFYPLYEGWAKNMRPNFVTEVRLLAKKIMNGEEVCDGQDTVFE